MTRYLSHALHERLGQPLAGNMDPDVMVIANVLCTPPLIPYALLRRIRRSVLPPGTLDVEGALCSAWFVEGIAVDGIMFENSYSNKLRSRLRHALVDDDLEADLAGLRGLIEDETTTLSPLLRLEERLCWAYVTEAEFMPTVEKIFSTVVHTVVQERRVRILSWVAGAFSRLPPQVVNGSAAWVLAQLCEAAGLPCPALEWPGKGVDDELLRDALALLPDTLLGIHRNGENLEIGWVSAKRRVAIPVPAVTPKILTVTRLGPQPVTTLTRVDLATGVTVVSTGRSAISIRDMRGRTYHLAEFTEDTAPENAAIDNALAELDRRWRSREEFDAIATRTLPHGKGLIVSFPEFPGCTGLLPASRARLKPFSFDRLGQLEGTSIRVRVINMDRPLQRVVVERTSSAREENSLSTSWTTGSLEVGSRFWGTVTNKVNFGVFVSFAAAADIDEATEKTATKKLDGLVHRSELSWTKQWENAKEYPVDIGDQVEVCVIEIDEQKQRVGLSIKRTQPDPWTVVSTSLRVGDRVRAPVVKIVPFGWFLTLAAGYDGLLHISEAPEGSTFELSTVLTVWVLTVDAEQRRVSLTLRPPPWPG